MSIELDNLLKKYTKRGELPCAFACLGTRDKGMVYCGSSGLKNIDDKSSTVDNDTILAFFSCTKAVTATALLQLLENGKIKSIDDLVEDYLPEINDIKLLKGFDDDNKPILVDDVNKVTIRHLLTHTAGFSYSFFSYAYQKLYDTQSTANIIKSEWDQFTTPLIFEPGTKWHYGVGIDWVGKIIERVTNLSLGDYCKINIFDRINAKSLTFKKSANEINFTLLHQRGADGSVTSLGDILVNDAKFHPGGHGLYGQIGDFYKFLEIFLHEGKSPETNEQILKPSTLENYSFKNLLPENVSIESTLEHSQPEFSNEVLLFESFPKELQGWTSSFHKTDIELPTGRSSGSFNWGGLANLYYWIDINNGIAGIFATQLFPFLDKVAVEASSEFETLAYKSL